MTQTNIEPRDDLVFYIMAGIKEWEKDYQKTPTIDELCGALLSLVSETFAANWMTAKAGERHEILAKAMLLSRTLADWVAQCKIDIETNV